MTIQGTIMNEFYDIARNKNRFRAACKDLNVKELKNMSNLLATFIETRLLEEANLLERKAKKDAEKKAILLAITEAGLKPEDFFSQNSPKKEQKARKPVAPQYRITDAQGIQHQWSGRGRTPKAFDHYFSNGGSKDSCRI